MKQLVDLAKGKPNIAYLYAVIGNFILGVGQIIFKGLTKYLHPFQAIFFRSLFAMTINLCLMRRENKETYIKSTQTFFKLSQRVLVNTLAFSIMLYCLKYIPVSTVTTLFNMGPIFIFFIEMLHYKMPMNKINFILTLVSFLGVVFMIQPEFLFGSSQTHKTENYIFYVFLMICAAFGNAINLHMIHSLAKKVDQMMNVHYSHVGTIMVIGIVCNMAPQVMPVESYTLQFFLLLLGISLTGIFSITFIFMANSLKKPSVMMPFGYVGVATGFLADIYLFDTSFTLLTFMGVVLTSGGLLSGFLLHKQHKEHVLTKQQQKELQTAKQNQDILLSFDSEQQKEVKK